MEKFERWEVFGQRNETPETWLWCLHCERAYQLKNCRRVTHRFLPGEHLEMCAYADCNGDTVLDAQNWGGMDELRDRPAVPEVGKRYPLYRKS